MKLTSRACLLALLGVAGAAMPQLLAQTGAPVNAPAPAPLAVLSTPALFEKTAKELEFFDLRSFLYNRDELFVRLEDPNGATNYFNTLKRVLDLEIPVAEIEPLLQSDDARVRTLALAALFQREDAHLLPLIVEMASDKTITFPGHGRLSKQWLQLTGIGPPPETQSVGHIASKMVEFYLEQAGFFYGRSGRSPQPDWPRYWEGRKDRRFTASWFAVKLARASRGISATQERYRPAIRTVRAQIDALAPADRDWTLLYLNGETGSDFLVSDAELLEAAKRRGLDALLAVLREKIPSDDPDLQSRSSNNWPYKRLSLWILDRAPQLLAPAMADDILACELSQRDYLKRGISDPLIDAAWPIAAARLQPQRAESVLRAAWTRFNGEFDGDNRAQIAAAMAFSNLPTQDKFVINWFFAPAPEKYDGVDSSGKGNAFVGRLGRTQGAERMAARRFLSRLVSDPRFDATDFQTVIALVKMANDDAKTPVFDIQKLYERAYIGQPATSPDAKQALAEARAKLREIYARA